MSSYYPLRTRPAVGPDAFSRVDPETAPSQAAVLLLIGRQLRGDDDALLERARKVRRGTRVQMSALEADDDFPVPTIPPTRRRFRVEAVRRVTSSYGHRPRRADTWRKAYADCAASLYSRPNHETATALLELSLSHPLALVRIAAAAAYYPVTADRARRGDVSFCVLLEMLTKMDGPNIAGSFHEPGKDSPMAVEEVFGPALPIWRVRDLDEALELANASPFGLGSSVWTSDLNRAERAAAELDCGYTWINSRTKVYDELPFGGLKASGYGKEHGSEALDYYTDLKSVVVKRG